MNKAQIEVITWWYGCRDYRTGIELLTRYGRNKIIIITLAKQGKENFVASVKKLNYEVTKAVQLNWLHMPADLSPEQNGAKSLADIPNRENKKDEKYNPADTSFHSEKEKKNDDTNQYPRIIRRLKNEYSNLYNKKRRLQSDMRMVKQSNTEKNKEWRTELLSEIKSISKKLSFYYGFLEKYEVTGIVPDETEIWPLVKVPAPEKPKSLPDLKKLMWSLRRETAKDVFRLQYQQRTKAEKENPMPQGAKRNVIEQRIKLRKNKLAEIMKLIAADTELQTSINMAVLNSSNPAKTSILQYLNQSKL